MHIESLLAAHYCFDFLHPGGISPRAHLKRPGFDHPGSVVFTRARGCCY